MQNIFVWTNRQDAKKPRRMGGFMPFVTVQIAKGHSIEKKRQLAIQMMKQNMGGLARRGKPEELIGPLFF
ncbi:hypothetical protein [Fischerella thermalis]|uniref:tautomerase family protein n=1 Tax=Fischerella thermalis TaxID=372787 RepID=UPI00307E3E8F